MIISYATGFFGNTISVLVYLHKKFREKSLGIYFVAVCVSEQLLLISNLLVIVKPYLWLQTDFLCRGIPFIQMVLSCTSSWLQVLNSIIRTLMVLYPKRLLFMRKIAYQILFILLIVAISLALSSVTWLNNKLVVGDTENSCSANESMDMYYYSLAVTLFYLVLIVMFF
jgi:hypothetical protein